MAMSFLSSSAICIPLEPNRLYIEREQCFSLCCWSMKASSQNLIVLIWVFLLGVLTSSTKANFNETWFPTHQNITLVGTSWSAGWGAAIPSNCLLYRTATRFTGSPGDYATILFKGMCQPLRALEFPSLKRGHLLTHEGIGIYAESFFNQSSSLVTIIFDGEQTSLDPAASIQTPGCGMLFAQSGLSYTLHNLTVVNMGPQARRWLYLDRFLCV